MRTPTGARSRPATKLTAQLYRHRLTPADIQLRNIESEALELRRLRKGGDFSYVDGRNKPVSAREKARIESLAIPPAWQSVRIAGHDDNYLLAFGDDEQGRRQYIYHPEWRAACEMAKFIDLPRFAERLPRLRRVVRNILKNTSACGGELALAVAIRLLDRGGLRVGNWRSTTHGTVSLKDDHVEIAEDMIELCYDAKGGKERQIKLVDPKLAAALNTLIDGETDDIFEIQGQRLRPRQINEFISETMGLPFSAKDFRTWGGSCRAARALFRDKAQTLKAVSEAAADWLGNTPAIAQSSYIHPAILDAVKASPELKLAGPTRLRKYERVCYALTQNYTTPVLKRS